ncbi:sulfatase-like hydrolase/transferase [Polaribacter glomeratus]|uniref:Sulfatase n=1 Tax=Polaribacter glomeratus TaxID=102 RepID=A0A2S7WZ04_9FLAO|nr:sulfatase-like hydrolase/transferase [Polaribacter glomeratus]PQJ82820.1 sulfatase [Polaribacter glomeratus]TXD65362.1 sulfatase-like hydrolase/transferase [Polaribacter glomeratus]
MKLNLYITIFLCSFVLVSCSNQTASTEPIIEVPNVKTPNILFIIADDLGKDALNGYSEGTIKPLTPNIDAIRNNGISFTNFWTNPTCTPTRASLITGKYGYRTGVKSVGDQLSTSETTLQKYISTQTNNTYASALVGKWHLSGNNTTVNPETFGIDYYAGFIRGAVEDYYQWQLNENGASSQTKEYITEVFTDLSINWIQQQSKPWFLWLAYNAPHTPFHVPPSNMHNQGNLPTYSNGLDPIPYYMAAIEAMDYQIGRLLDSIPEDERNNTILIFIGDNGTPNQVAQSTFSSATVKNTLYQGGVNVPMFISGNSVSRSGTDDNLINSTDLFATIAEIAGSSAKEIYDSKSFKTLFTQSTTIREYQYTELVDGATDNWTISNGEYKLIVNSVGAEEMYHLVNDPYEKSNLLKGTLSTVEQNTKSELETELAKIRS